MKNRNSSNRATPSSSLIPSVSKSKSLRAVASSAKPISQGKDGVIRKAVSLPLVDASRRGQLSRPSGTFGGRASPAKTSVGSFAMSQNKFVVEKESLVARAVFGKIPELATSIKPTSKEIKLNFKENDKIVYPGHGVGIINTIQARSIGGETHHIFEITIMESGMKVMVPVVQAQAVGIRKVIDKKSVEKVFTILRDRDFKIDTQTWNRRFREYSNKIKTGSPFEIAEVLRDLSVLSVDKQLSFGEKKMLDMAQSLLVSEIAIAKARSADKVIGEIKACFQ